MNIYSLKQGNPTNLMGEVFVYSKYIGPNLENLIPKKIPDEFDEFFPTKIRHGYIFTRYRNFKKINDELQSKLISVEEVYEAMKFKDPRNPKFINSAIILKPNSSNFLKDKDALFVGEHYSIELCNKSIDCGLNYYNIQFQEQDYKLQKLLRSSSKDHPEELFKGEDLRQYYEISIKQIAQSITQKNQEFCIRWDEFMHELKNVNVHENELHDLETYITEHNGNSDPRILSEYASIILAFHEQKYELIPKHKNKIKELIQS